MTVKLQDDYSYVNINDQYFSGFYINNDGRNCEQCPIEEGIDIDNTSIVSIQHVF